MAAAAALALLAALACGCLAEGERLLRAGKTAEVLRRVRPVSAAACRLRAAALRAERRPQAARDELRLALLHDERSADTHRVLGYVEAELGAAGAAVEHLGRSLELKARQPAVRTALAGLLLQRARLRVDPAVGLLERDEARRDLERAAALDPQLARRAAPLLEAATHTSQPAGAAPSACPGPPPGLSGRGIPGAGRCTLRGAAKLALENARRHLLVGCAGPGLALRLEDAGCREEALSIWAALEAEAPGDPRWPLQAGRVLLGLGRDAEARLRFTDHLFLASDRGAALLGVARLLLSGGRRREAAGHAADSLPFATSLGQQLEALSLLVACGEKGGVREARELVLARGWGLPAERLRALIEAALGDRGLSQRR